MPEQSGTETPVWVVEVTWPVQLTKKDAERAVQQALRGGAVQAAMHRAVMFEGGGVVITGER